MNQAGTINILHVLGRMNRGGAEMRTLDLMRHINRNVYKFDFCCLSGLPGELDQDVVSLGGRIHLLELDARFPTRFRKLLRENRYHVVHSNVHWPSGYILRLAAKEGVPQRICHFASTSDGKNAGTVRRLRNRLLKQWVNRYATNILGVSKGALTAVWGVGWTEDDRCRVIYRGIDTTNVERIDYAESITRDFNLPYNAAIVIHIGRMDMPKNHLRLVRIFECLLQYLPNAYLVLVGATREPVHTEVVRAAALHGIGSKVVITGVRSDVACLLAASEMMIFPSLWEGLPGAVLEALAAGVPVLASKLPGTDEIAAYLPGIRTMSLDCSDEQWAAAASDYRSYFGPSVDAREALEASPFNMRRAVEAYESLYSAAA